MSLKVAEILEDDPEYDLIKKYWSEDFLKKITNDEKVSIKDVVEIKYKLNTISIIYNSK